MNRRNFLKWSFGAAATCLAAPLLIGKASVSENIPKKVSNLEKIHVRNVIKEIQNRIHEVCSRYMGDINSTYTRKCLTSEVATELNPFVSQRLIDSFMVVCDETNNRNPSSDALNVCVNVWVTPGLKHIKLETSIVSDKSGRAIAENVEPWYASTGYPRSDSSLRTFGPTG